MATWSRVHISELPDDIRFDAEYYQPHHLALDSVLQKRNAKKWGDLDGTFVVGPFGSAFLVENYIPFSNYRYIRGRDVKPFMLLDDQNAYMPEEHFRRLQKYEVAAGDLLISVVGTLGNAAIVTEKEGRCVFSCKSTAYRSREVDSYYLCAYLNSGIGQEYLKRAIRGHVQTGLNLNDLKAIPIVIPSRKESELVSSLVNRAFTRHRRANELFLEAEAIFATETGLPTINLTEDLTYIRRFRDTRKARRLEAEFFKPKYRRTTEALEKTKPIKIKTIGDSLEFLTNGHTPLRHDLSKGEVLFLTAEHVFDFRLNFETEKRILKEHHQGELKRTRLRIGDVLVTIKGKVGNAAVVAEVSSPSNINQDVALLRLKDHLPSYYLVAYMNSIAGRMFTRQYATGQINPFLGLGNLRMLPLPIYDSKTMQRIAKKTLDTIQKAESFGQESRYLLDSAKRKVEEMVIKQ